jgi:hypothetical protein
MIDFFVQLLNIRSTVFNATIAMLVPTDAAIRLIRMVLELQRRFIYQQAASLRIAG